MALLLPWTEPTETFAYASSVGTILAMSPARWLRTDTLGTFSNSAAVPSWSDSSGNARALAQATDTKQPLYGTALQNGLAGVVFNGTDDWMPLAGFPLPNNAG